MINASISGWAHSKFGKLDNLDVERSIAEMAVQAVEHAGLDWEDIDSVHIGHFNGGFLYQDFPSSLIFNHIPELRFRPAVRVENACATGSAAVHSGLDAVRSGKSKHALVIGYEKMNTLPTAEVGKVLLKCSYAEEEANVEGGFAGVFGHIIAKTYFERYGDQLDALAAIAAKNHANGAHNPYAHLQKDLGFEFCRQESEKNPYVAGKLKRTDCSMVSDGVAALVISNRHYTPNEGMGFYVECERIVQHEIETGLLVSPFQGKAEPVLRHLYSMYVAKNKAKHKTVQELVAVIEAAYGQLAA